MQSLDCVESKVLLWPSEACAYNAAFELAASSAFADPHNNLLKLCLCRFRQSRSAAKKAPVTALQGTRESVNISYGAGKVSLHARSNTALEELTAVVSMFLLFGCDVTRSTLCFLLWCSTLCCIQPLLLLRLALRVSC